MVKVKEKVKARGLGVCRDRVRVTYTREWTPWGT